MDKRANLFLWPIFVAMFWGALAIPAAHADELLKASRTELAIGETATLEIPGALGLVKPKWTTSPAGIVDFVDLARTEAEVKGIKPGTVKVSAKVKSLFGSDTYSITLQVTDKSAGGKDDPGAVKLTGLMRGMGFPDTDTRIARLLYEVTHEIRGADSFYAELKKIPGAKMTDVIALRSRLVDMPDSSLARQVMGPGYPEGGTLVEQRILSWRKKQTLEAINEVMRRFAGRVPADGVQLIVAHVGKWASQDSRSLQFPGDIDFSFVCNDLAFAEALKAEYLNVIRDNLFLDQIAVDSVSTVHGKAGLEVYIGRHGMKFAEDMMKVNYVVDLEKGTTKPASFEAVTDILARERAMLEAQGKEPIKPVLDTEPGLSMEMVRHFDHDIAKSGIFDVTNAVVKAAKYLDRSYNSLNKSGGTPADPKLAAFAKQITEWANAKPQTAQIREDMIRLISEHLGSPPRTVWDEGKQKLMLTLDNAAIKAFHDTATQAMWMTVEQGSKTHTEEMDTRLRDLLERQRKGEAVEDDVARLREDMKNLVDMVEAEVKAINKGMDIPVTVLTNNARVRAMMDTLSKRFGVKVLSADELKDKKFVEELLKAQAEKPSQTRAEMLKAYIMDRTARTAELSMQGVEKANNFLDIIDDGLLGPLRGDAEFADFEAEMKNIRQASVDPKAQQQAAGRLAALKGKVANGIKNANQKINGALQATAAGRQGMKFMMVYGLVDEMQSYRDAFNQEGWGGFATELFRRRIPLGSAVENAVMGNTYRAGWDVVTTLVPPLALPEAAWGLGRALGEQTLSTYWSEQLRLFSDGLYDSARFQLVQVETHGDAKVGVYRLVSVKHRGISIDLRQFADMRQEQVEALRQQVGKKRLDWAAYKKEFQGLTNWMEVDTLLQRNIAATDPMLLMLEEMITHPSVVGSAQEKYLAEKGLVRWEEVKLGFITNLIKHLEDRKQADQALASGQLPDLFAELRKTAAALEVEDAMLRALDAEVDTNNLKALVKWMWDTKRSALGQAPTESETSRAAQVVKKYLDTYKAILATRDQLLGELPGSAGRDGATRWLTGDLFLSGRADPDLAAAERWAKQVEAARQASRDAVLAIKKEFLPNLGLEADDEAVVQRVFPRELWMRPYKDAGTARNNIALLDRAIDHGKARNAILDEYRKSLERQAPVQLTVTLVDGKDARQLISSASGDLEPTDALGKRVRASGTGSQLLFGAPMGRYRLTVNAPGYEAASKDLTLGRGLNPTPKVTLSLTPSKDKKDGAGDDKSFMAEVDAALAARNWQALNDKLDTTRKDQDLRLKQTERWDARMKAVNSALETLKGERMKWLLAWEAYIRELERVDNRAYDSLKNTVEKQVTAYQNRCFEQGGDPAHLRSERCQKEAYAYEEKCLPKAQRDAHWAEQKRIRDARNLLPDEVHLMHSAGFPTYRAWFEKVEALAKVHGLPFPYPEPVVARLKYVSQCASLEDAKSTKKLEDLSGLKVSLKGPSAPVPLGKPVTLTASASGGNGAYSYAWSGAAGSGTRATITPTWAGDWTVSVAVRDGDGKGGEASVTVMVSPMKVKLAGAKGQVFYGSQAKLSTEGLGLEVPAPEPVPDPCAGKPRGTNPFDECGKIEVTAPPVSTCSLNDPFCVDTSHPGVRSFGDLPPTQDGMVHDPNLVRALPESGSGSGSGPAPISQAPKPGEYQIVWQAEPGLTFEPPKSNDGKTRVTYDRMGQVKLWCELLQFKEGDFHTVGECDQVTVSVVAPKFSVSFAPGDGQARVGQEVRARIVASPSVPAKLIDYRWLEPGTANRMEYGDNAGEIGFRVRDANTLVLKALARVPYHGDEIATVDATYTGATYEVKAWVVEPGTRPMMWDAKKGGLVPVPKGSYATFERIGLRAEVQGGAPEGVRWNWTVNDGTSLSNPISQTPTVSRGEAGGISARVTARDKEGRELGSAEVSLSVIQVSDQPPKPSPAEEKEKTQKQKQAEARKLAKQAEDQLKRGDLPGAAQSARQARDLDPATAGPAARKVADAAKKAGWQGVYDRDFKQVVPNLETAVDLNPDDKDARDKLERARRFVQVWPQVEAKAREFDAQMAEKKYFSAHKSILAMQDLQMEMPGVTQNALPNRVMKDFDAGMKEYNTFMNQVQETHRRSFKEEDWQVMLDNAEQALAREHSLENEKMLRGNVEFARQQLAQRDTETARHGKNVVGTWAINGNGYQGKLEISEQDGKLTGRVWYDLHSRWEALRDVSFNGRNLVFTRPIPGATQRYTGAVAGKEFRGTFTQEGTSKVYNWSAKRADVPASPTEIHLPPGLALATDKASYSPGETVTLRWGGIGQPAAQDWIGLYAEGAANEKYGEWHYLKAQAGGTLPFKAPQQPGIYEFRLFLNWPAGGYKDVARSPRIRVGAAAEASPAGSSSTGTQTVAVPVGSGGLIATYALDGDARDGSGNGRHGTLNGAIPTTDRFGRANGAMAFNGKAWIDLPIDINPGALPQLSFTAWVRADEANPVRQVMSHDNGGYDRSLGIDYRGGGNGWSVFTGSSSVLGVQPVEIGRWTFVAGVWDQAARKVRLHVDERMFEKSGESGGGHATMSLGRNPSYGEYLVGAMDDVRLYSRVLSPGEIATLRGGAGTARDSAYSGPAANVAGKWKTSEGELTLNQAGNRVQGTYTSDGGVIEGEVKGNVLEGWWIENSSGQNCGVERNGRKHWGRIRWTFEGDRFAGGWSYCDGQVKQEASNWKGERIGTAPVQTIPPPVRNNAEKSLDESVDDLKKSLKDLKGLFNW